MAILKQHRLAEYPQADHLRHSARTKARERRSYEVSGYL
jgi:hypothetical protein